MQKPQIRQRLVEVEGHRGLILEAGSGPTVVVLSSILVLARSYLPLMIRCMARDFRVLVVEFPGSGRGSRLPRAWSFDHYARWTSSLLGSLQLDHVTLVGHSNSGPVATLIAASGDPHVARLVLADCIGADERFSIVRVLAGRSIDCLYEPILTLQAWHHVLLNAIFHPRNFWNQVRLSARTDLRTLLPLIRVPVLIAWGRNDHTMPTHCGRVFKGSIPNSRIYISIGGSHDWLITDAWEFTRAVQQFQSETP